MIRVATREDLPVIVELGKMLHEESVYREFSYDPDKVFEHMGMLIDGGGVVFLAVRDGEVVGGVAGGVAEQWFSREKIAFDYTLFIRKDCRNGVMAMKLIVALTSWGKAKGVKTRMGITTGINVEGSTRLYLACGMKPAGVLFQTED